MREGGRGREGRRESRRERRAIKGGREGGRTKVTRRGRLVGGRERGRREEQGEFGNSPAFLRYFLLVQVGLSFLSSLSLPCHHQPPSYPSLPSPPGGPCPPYLPLPPGGPCLLLFHCLLGDPCHLLGQSHLRKQTHNSVHITNRLTHFLTCRSSTTFTSFLPSCGHIVLP